MTTATLHNTTAAREYTLTKGAWQAQLNRQIAKDAADLAALKAGEMVGDWNLHVAGCREFAIDVTEAALEAGKIQLAAGFPAFRVGEW